MMDFNASATRDDLLFMLINEDADPEALPFSFLSDITSGFSDENMIGRDRFATVYKGSIGNRLVAVKRLNQFRLDLDCEPFIREVKCLIKVKHKNVVRFLGYCYETQGEFSVTLVGKNVIAQIEERLLCFEYLPGGSLHRHITDASSGLDWEHRYQIINGVCKGLHYLHEEYILHLDLKPQSILLDEDMVPKIADFGLSRCLEENQTEIYDTDIMGTMGYTAPEFIHNGVITKKCDLYSLGVIIMELLTGRKRCHDHAVDDVLDDWRNRLGGSGTAKQLDQIKVCLGIAIECIDPNPANRPPNTMDIIHRLEKLGSTQILLQEPQYLQVHPIVLLFDLQPWKLSPCSLQLTNDTDKHMAFKLNEAESVGWSNRFRLPRYGVVAARSTCTLVLTVLVERVIPENRFCDMILESYSASDMPPNNSDDDECEALFNAKKARKNVVRKVKLTAFLSKKKKRDHQPIISMLPTVMGVRISYMEEPRTPLFSIDAHPTKPWIITGHECGNVNISIQHHETQRLLYSFKVSMGPVYSVKFIVQRQWFISSSAEGLIHVYSYGTGMLKIKSFRAHLGPVSLAVHPTQPYVLSSSRSGYHDEMKLWDWNKGWECIQTFQTAEYIRGSNLDVRQIAFDPKETNRFATCCSSIGRVKVWSLDSPKPIYTLAGRDFKSVTFLEFFTRDDQRYLIITDASSDMTAHIWDMQKKVYLSITDSQTSSSPVASVFSHPNLPILLTPSVHGTHRLWSHRDLRLQGVLDYRHGGDVRGTTCLMGSKRRFVIGQEAALTILDIDDGEHQDDSGQSSEPQSCAGTGLGDTSDEIIEFNKLERILAGIEEPDHLDLYLLDRITEHFSMEKRIGQGGCGEVYKGILRNGVVAVKRLFKSWTAEDKMFLRELKSLVKTRHENIVQFLGYCCVTEERLYTDEEGRSMMVGIRERLICLEFISNGSLDLHITDELRGLEFHTRYEIIVGICKGLLHLHVVKDIIHMDLKPANILLNDGMVPKITDFGVSRFGNNAEAATTSPLVSLPYCAPEYRLECKSSSMSDIYSLGVIITEMVTGSRKTPDVTKVLRKWRHRWIKSSKDTPPLGLQQVTKCLQLAQRCRQEHPADRPDISEIVNDLNTADAKDDQSPVVEDILGIEPLEIHVPLGIDQQISRMIELSNDTEDHIAFMTEAGLKCIRAKPEKGIVPPGSKCTVTITVQAQINALPVPINDQYRQITVLSRRVDGTLAATDVTRKKFIDEEEGVVVDEVSVMVICGKPASAEGS